MTIRWQGVFPAVTTQFQRDESLDLRATAAHLEKLIAAGVDGLVMCGSLGENQTMAPEEKREVIRTAVQVAKGRIPVISGVAETSTAAACLYVRDCQAIGADGFMIMPPMVYRSDAAETLAFFQAVAGSSGLPWMLYNNPLAYTVDVTPMMLEPYAEIPNLVAIKESSSNPRRIREIQDAVGDRFGLFVGVDDVLLESAILGIDGWVAGTGIAFPEENQHLWNLTRQGRWEEARELYRWFGPLLKLDTEIKFVQYIKLVLQEVGLGAEWVRSPRRPIEGRERERVLKIIRDGIASRPSISAGFTH